LLVILKGIWKIEIVVELWLLFDDTVAFIEDFDEIGESIFGIMTVVFIDEFMDLLLGFECVD
jgi:hypothetical protein